MGLSDEQFLTEYQTYVEQEIRPLRQEVQRALSEWQGFGYWTNYAPFEGAADPKPIQRIKLRIKRPESVLDKIHRLPEKFPTGKTLESLHGMRDLLGARIVTYFPLNLAMVDRELRRRTKFELSSEYSPKSYLNSERLTHIHLDPTSFDVRGRKPSGYSSLHYTVSLKTENGTPSRPFELQTRTMLEETWGEIEHQLGYKPDKQTEFSVRRQFRVISEHLEAVDTHFDFLYDHLTFLQSLSQPEDDDILNAENLPSVINTLGITCEQGSIGWLLDILEIHGITTVGVFRNTARPDVVEAIVDQYAIETEGRTPTAKDVVPVLAKLPAHPTSSDARSHLRSNLRMTAVTESVRNPAQA